MAWEKIWIRALEWKERETSEKVDIVFRSAETESMMRNNISGGRRLSIVRVIVCRSKAGYGSEQDIQNKYETSA